MRIAYRVLAIIMFVMVGLQAAFVVWADAGLFTWISGGGVADLALLESEGTPFPEVAGFMYHGMTGMMVIPVIALALLVVSFFAKVPGAVKWAVIVVVLVALQIALGMLGHMISAMGFLHGLNALALAAAAFYAQLRAGRPSGQALVSAPEQPAARV